MTAPTVLHLAPHPDDELIGAPAALMALRDAGWTVVNLTCSLGAEDQRRRRRAEVAEACRRAGFVSEVLEPPLTDPLPVEALSKTRERLVTTVGALATRLRPRIVVAPSPHDRHRGHEVVGRAAVEACAGTGGGPDGGEPERLWLWGLWADLPFPSLAVGFGAERMEEIVGALAAHAGELARNDYRRLVRGRAEMNSALGPERVFGFGCTGSDLPYVELLTEVGRQAGRWCLGLPRWLEGSDPVGPLGKVAIGDWLSAGSVTDRYGPPG